MTLAAIAREIDAQRRVVDLRLSGPATWSGPLRREVVKGRVDHAARTSFAAIWDRMAVEVAAGRSVDAGLLRDAHAEMGGDGQYRTGSVYVGEWTPAVPVSHVAAAVDAAIELATTTTEPVALAAARLHLSLLRVHPFEDGNGRAVRLLASALLVRAGWRSTLVTAVEQHFADDPSAYGASFRALDEPESGGEDGWLHVALVHHRSASAQVAWLRRRNEALRDQLRSLSDGGPAELERRLTAYDLGHADEPSLRALSPPWHQLRRTWSDCDLNALRHQLRRLRSEELM